MSASFHGLDAYISRYLDRHHFPGRRPREVIRRYQPPYQKDFERAFDSASVFVRTTPDNTMFYPLLVRREESPQWTIDLGVCAGVDCNAAWFVSALQRQIMSAVLGSDSIDWHF